ncbi:MAG: NADP-dependent oxidoreductase [Gammaproteobacteria bacterium]|jgi:NADPH-dependent curcumin reductase CurA|nr:NADP-dependent oxidoreductase [Gammaproteobacteria bacterium]
MPFQSQEVHLVAYPDGMPAPADFALREVNLPDPGEGEIVICNQYMSVDPAMRPRLTPGQQPLNTVMSGGAVGVVAASRNPALKEGDLVQHGLGFREFATSDGTGVRVLAPGDLPVTVYMHALGGTGFTAWGGLLVTGALRDGENVFVSAAAGAVGSVAVQIARIKGCYVIGSAGSAEKCAWLTEELGIDVAINYREGTLRKSLKAAAKNGIDVYFENVGGDHLDAAMPRMNLGGRIPVCGMISAYNTPGARSTGVTTLSNMIYMRVRMEGFVVPDFEDQRAQFESDMKGWLTSGEMRYRETIMEGIERAPDALIGLMAGENIGKMLVKLS